MGPGENAGVVDVGGGLGVAFKVESHNHPSAVEPFQGAATGVGGILRDIFAVGARPIAVLDSLRFGEPATSARSRYLLERAVAGIGHYGNSIGVPTVGGEIYFEHSYEHNCLINAMCLGLAPHERLIRAAAAGPGNVLVLLGALTGRDGIGGASVLASAELGEGDEAKRPSVQIGDPFAEKKLLECSLELLDSELLVSLQDLGAAGLTSSASEMAAKGGVGLDIDCDRVPLREPGLEPFEIMVSESQERMLCVVEPDRVDDVIAVCERWETLRDRRSAWSPTRGRMRILAGGEVVADLPVSILVDDCPLYDLEPRRRPARAAVRRAGGACCRRRVRRRDAAGAAGSSNIVSRRPVFEQYDPVVQSRTVRRPEQADAAVLALPTGRRSRSRSTATVAASPAIRAPARSRSCSSARPTSPASAREPLGLTNCLNFGNPEKPHVAWQLTEAVDGLARRLRRARDPGRRRQRLALQRGAERADLPDAGDRHGRRAARPGPRRRAGVRRRGRRDRAGRARSRRRRAARSSPSCAARRSPVRCRRSTRRPRPRGARAGPRTRALRRASAAPTTSPRAASRSRWPSAASPAGSAHGCALPEGSTRSARRSGGRSSSPGREERWPA